MSYMLTQYVSYSYILTRPFCYLYLSLANKNHGVNQVGDLGFASELGNYAEYSGAPNEDEVLQYARVVIDVIF